MAKYKLSLGELSRIRTDEAGVKELQKKGYTLLGECDDSLNIINANPVFETKSSDEDLEALRAQAVKLGMTESQAKKYKNVDSLKAKIVELQEAE